MSHDEPPIILCHLEVYNMLVLHSWAVLRMQAVFRGQRARRKAGSAAGQWMLQRNGADPRGTETAAECEKDPGPLALASPLAGLK